MTIFPKQFTDLEAWAKKLTLTLELNMVSKQELMLRVTELEKRLEVLENANNGV